jgi:hypothetical protein
VSLRVHPIAHLIMIGTTVPAMTELEQEFH